MESCRQEEAGEQGRQSLEVLLRKPLPPLKLGHLKLGCDVTASRPNVDDDGTASFASVPTDASMDADDAAELCSELGKLNERQGQMSRRKQGFAELREIWKKSRFLLPGRPKIVDGDAFGVMATQAWAEGQQQAGKTSSSSASSGRRSWKQLFGKAAKSRNGIQEVDDVIDDCKMPEDAAEARGLFARCHVAEKKAPQAWHCQSEPGVRTPGYDVSLLGVEEPVEPVFLQSMLGNCPAPFPSQLEVSSSQPVDGGKALEISRVGSMLCQGPASLESLLGNIPGPGQSQPSAEAGSRARPEPCTESASLECLLGNCPSLPGALP